jgi:hypothetical protein
MPIGKNRSCERLRFHVIEIEITTVVTLAKQPIQL